MLGARMDRFLSILRKAAWAFFWISLPVTSFPFFPADFGGKALVRPLSMYPLAALLLLTTLPRLWRKQLPKTYLPLLAFILVALISALLSLSSEPATLMGVSQTDRLARNLLTLLIGASFYLTVSLYIDSQDELQSSLRWLYAGFAIALIWGTFQAAYIIDFSQDYFRFLNKIQAFISTRKLFTTRISGMTYEPKWFAEQICFLLMPWLIGSVLSGKSVFAWRFKRLSVEMILLLWSAAVMIFTFSRTGILILVLLTFFSIIYYGLRSAARSREGLSINKHTGRTLVQALLAVAILLALVLATGTRNPYFSRFWRYWTTESIENRTYFEYIGASQRIIYLVTAYHIYADNPLFGVGPGNYAFNFIEYAPNQPYHRQPEIVRQLTPSEGRDRLITPKNLYARLLAETGLVGSAVFTAFVLAVTGCALYLWRSTDAWQRAWGLSGLLGMLVFAIALWSFDSFAIPSMWVLFGLITAAAYLPADGSNEAANQGTAGQVVS
jgi:hypothetical protein